MQHYHRQWLTQMLSLFSLWKQSHYFGPDSIYNPCPCRLPPVRRPPYWMHVNLHTCVYTYVYAYNITDLFHQITKLSPKPCRTYHKSVEPRSSCTMRQKGCCQDCIIVVAGAEVCHVRRLSGPAAVVVLSWWRLSVPMFYDTFVFNLGFYCLWWCIYYHWCLYF